MNMNTQLVRVNTNYEQFLDNVNLSKASKEVAVIAAKSILSTELVRLLSPIVYGAGMSPMHLSKEIINNIGIENFVSNDYSNVNIIESLLYNEFYKILTEIKDSSSIIFNFEDKLNRLCFDVRSTVHYIMTILTNSQK